MSRTVWPLLGVLALLVAFLVGDRRRAEHDRLAQAGRDYAVADSITKALAPQLARVDTLVVRDTVRVRVAVDRVVTLRDTVLAHLTDTVRIKEYLARTDTALHACTDLARDCAQFRAIAIQRFAADSTKLAALRASIPKPPRCGRTCGFITGAVLVAGVVHFTR